MSSRPAQEADPTTAPQVDEQGRQVLKEGHLWKKVLVEGTGPKPVYRADVKGQTSAP